MHANWSTSTGKPSEVSWPEEEAAAMTAATPVLVVSSPARASMPVAKAPAPPRPRSAPRTTPGKAELPGDPVEPEATPSKQARRINLTQVICWQVAVALVIASIRQPWPILVTAVLTAAVLAASALRIRGRWPAQLVGCWLSYLGRPRRHDLPRHGTSQALLELLLPGASVVTVPTAHGPVAAISHPHGMTAVVRVDLDRGPLAPADFLPPEGQFSVQAVLHTGVRAAPPPRGWLAVQAMRTVDLPGDEELTIELRNALRRMLRLLKRANVPAVPLPVDETLRMVSALAHVNNGRTEIREDWGFWRTGMVSQACFRLRDWDSRLLVGLLIRAAGVAATVTVTAGTGTSTEAVLRLAASTEHAISAVLPALTEFAARCGVRLVRLDGTHVSGVAASLPIGGTNR